MKKLLIAAAAMAVVAGAQAQSSVTVYGIVDLGFSSVDDGSTTGGRSIQSSGNLAGNRIGFRGVEDLGGGLKASFVLESGFNADSGLGYENATNATNGGTSGLTFNRQSVLALSDAKLGTISMGRQYSPLHDIAGMETSGQGGWGTGSNAGVYTSRFDNSFAYVSPNISGFTAKIAYATATESYDATAVSSAAPATAGEGVAYNLRYTAGPVDLMVGAADINNRSATVINTKQTMYVGSYDFGFAKVSAGAAQSNPTANAAAAASNGYDTELTFVGVAIPVSKVGTVKLQASQVKKENGTDAEKKASMLQARYDHALSKRTVVYGVYGSVNNNTTGDFDLKNATETIAVAADKKANAFSIGVNHSF